MTSHVPNIIEVKPRLFLPQNAVIIPESYLVYLTLCWELEEPGLNHPHEEGTHSNPDEDVDKSVYLCNEELVSETSGIGSND